MTDRLAYSATEAAKALCISERTMWRLITSGEVSTFKLGTRTLIPADDLRALIDRRLATQPDPHTDDPRGQES